MKESITPRSSGALVSRRPLNVAAGNFPKSERWQRLWPLETPDGTFARDVQAAEEPALVFFYSPSCPYCRMLSPVIDELAVKFEGTALIARLTTTVNPVVSSQYGIQGVPTLLLFRGGKLQKRMVGVQSGDEIERSLKGIIKLS